MNLHDFIHTYFSDWNIANVITYGTERGHIKLRYGETFINIFFNLNGETRWTGSNVTVYSVKPAVDLF